MTQTTVRYFVTDVDKAVDFTAIALAFMSTFRLLLDLLVWPGMTCDCFCTSRA